ncbi:MAG TPA: hypothetical protein VFD92_25870 [Candidatus Binatia bacterium]|nr:hypothetical protein [Candidatus Binatia bacterium]
MKAFLTALRRKGLGKNTVRLARATLSVLFSSTVDNAILGTNPTRALEHGRKRRRAAKHARAERLRGMRPFSAGELAAFTSALRSGLRSVPSMCLGATSPTSRCTSPKAEEWEQMS